MKAKLRKSEKNILNCFLELSIPDYIKTVQIDGLDLMLCYEDICNRVHELIHFNKVNTKTDSWNEDTAFIFDGKYEIALFNIINTTTDFDLKIYALLTLSVLQILIKNKNFNEIV